MKTSPATTASFVTLTEKGFFDGHIFHRIVPGFVIQGGDPTGTGTGGPGYRRVDTPPVERQYSTGSWRWPRPGTSRPAPSGSQFFVVTATERRARPTTRCSARS